MRNTMKLICIIFIACYVSLLTGCNSIAKKNQSAINKIQSELQASIEQNQQLAQKLPAPKPVTVPVNVDRALIKDAAPVSKPINANRFNIAVNNQTIGDFFSGLAHTTNISFVINPKLTGTITLNMHNVTLNDIFSAIEQLYNFEIQKTDYGYLITPPHIETKTFIINYLNGPRNSTSSLTGTAGGSVSTSTKTPSFWHSIQTNLMAIIGCKNPTSSSCKSKAVEMNELTNTVIVNAYPRDMVAIKHYIDNLNKTLGQQVIIEAKAMAITLNKTHESGINWQVLAPLAAGSLGYNMNSTSEDASTNANIFSLKTNDLRSVVKLLSTEGTISDISSPRISTLNNQPAMIKVGNTEYFAVGASNTVQTTSTTTEGTSVNQIDLQPFFSGVSLVVTPHIGDNGTITLHIHPTISKTLPHKTTGQIGGADTTIELTTANTILSESDNMVQTRSGQVIVIGGMMLYTNQHENSSLPGLNNTPLQPLTGSASNIMKKQELVILLKATIVGNNTWVNDLRNTAKKIVTS